MGYDRPFYRSAPAPEIAGGRPDHYPVVVVGGGPVGLAAAVDLAQRGVPVLLLDEDNTVSQGSRLICLAKRTLEILAGLGIGERLAAKGVVWNTGKVFHRDRMIYAFDLLPEAGHRWPAFINIQQYYVEQFLVERCRALDGVELRWQSRVTGIASGTDGARLTVETPHGAYDLTCDWLLACDGVRSTLRRLLDLPVDGEVFNDRFLITDVVMKADFPPERRFWFDPPFHRGQSALLHKQPDSVWRVDLQLGPDADPDEEVKPERVRTRIEAMLGPDLPFEIAWVSLYTFRCQRLRRFRHGRVFFLGDAAHTVSPFGARGGNGGVQDADNLVWKLVAVMRGEAPDTLLDSYDAERIPAADENIRHSTRSTGFITPRSEASRAFRDAVLSLAGDHGFARRLVNSGRLSTPCVLTGSPLSTPDIGHFAGGPPAGAVAVDAPVRIGSEKAWLLDQLGPGFSILCFAGPPQEAAMSVRAVAAADGPADGGAVMADVDGTAARRYDARPGTVYLFRPDRHVAARARAADAAVLRAAVDRALGRGTA